MDHQRPRFARPLIALAAVTGLSADLLLRAGPWGVNFSLWGILLLAAVVTASRFAGDRLPPGAWMALLGGGLCAAFLTLRDSPALAVWNVAATLFAAGLLAARIPSLRRLTFVGTAWTMLLHAAFAIAGMVLLLREDLPNEPPDPARRPLPWGALARGLALALPPLLLFGGLLSSADARFEYLLTEVLRIDIPSVVGHLLLTAAVTWIVGGVLRGRFAGQGIPLPHGVRPGSSWIGPVETGILLGSLNLLFLGFVAVQFSYLFGGEAIVRGTPDLTYAGYARRGFFELVGVLCCALPLLLTAEWIVRKDRIPAVLVFRILAGSMILLLLAILGSAIQRLWLYAAAYGLTISRVHAAAVLVWTGATLLWFAFTVLRNRRDRFVSGAIVAGYAVFLLLNAADPDALVARVNLDRAAEGIEIDTRHLLELSDDAVPAVLERFRALDRESAVLVARTYLARYPEAFRADWRTWNTARIRAARAVRAEVPMLVRATAP